MSPSTLPGMLSVDQVLALDDDALAEYMRRKRSPNGGFDLDDIEGWTELPKDRRDQLAQRLRAGAAMVFEAVQSCPVDLDQVAARLRTLSDRADGEDEKNEALARILSTRGPLKPRSPLGPTPPELKMNIDVEQRRIEDGNADEPVYYKFLVQEGGRPCYPISMMDEVFADPDKYYDKLRPVMQYPFLKNPGSGWWWVFRYQWTMWDYFCRWQREMRGTYDFEVELARWLEIRLDIYTVIGLDGLLDTFQDSPSRARKFFLDVEEWRHHWQRDIFTFPGQGIAAYAQAVQQSLAEHGFTRSFRLEEDHKQQDKLTTWIEYLNFEYCRRDQFAKTAERLRLKRDAAWQTLVDSGVLQPSDTEKFILSNACWYQRNQELDIARGLWRMVQATHGPELELARRIHNPAQRRVRLEREEARFRGTEARVKALTRKNELIKAFTSANKPYAETQVSIQTSDLHIRWILAQLPLVEAEMNGESTSELGPEAGMVYAPGGKNRRPRDDGNDSSSDSDDDMLVLKLNERINAERKKKMNAESKWPISRTTGVASQDGESSRDEPAAKKQRRNGRPFTSRTNGSPAAVAAARGAAGSRAERRRKGQGSEAAQALPGSDLHPPSVVMQSPRRSARLAAILGDSMQASSAPASKPPGLKRKR